MRLQLKYSFKYSNFDDSILSLVDEFDPGKVSFNKR